MLVWRGMRMSMVFALLLGALLPWSSVGAPQGQATMGGKHKHLYQERIRKETLEFAGIDPKSLTAVKVFNSGNFSNSVPHKAKYTIVEFYTPWCGHCKKLAPVWEVFAQKVHMEPRLRAHVIVSKIDCDQNGDVCQKYNVESFPTLMYFNPQIYGGSMPQKIHVGHELEDLLGYAKSHLAKPPVKQRIYAFDLLAHEFYLAENNTELQQDIHDRASRSAEHFSAQKKYVAQIYVKIMNKAINKGNGTKVFFTDEFNRIHRMISSNTLGEDKIIDMLLRQVILGSFRIDHKSPGIAGMPLDAQLLKHEEEAREGSEEEEDDGVEPKEEL